MSVLSLRTRAKTFERDEAVGLSLKEEDEVVDKDLPERFWDLAINKLSGIEFGFEVEKD